MMNLDKSQLAFCEDPATHLRLLAPAGCGKTLSLLFRCEFLARNNKARQRFLIVTFTRAATDELRSRMAEDARFSSIRDVVEITTLNSWGYRRIRSVASYHKLIVTKKDLYFAAQNQLQAVWKSHERVGAAIEANKGNGPRLLMTLIDGFKSLGFDHVRDKNFDQFAARLHSLREQGLGPNVEIQIDNLARIGIVESKVLTGGREVASAGDKKMYDSFFRFWRDAAARLIDNATFTLEDQKYFAYLDEQQKVEDGNFLSGAARYDHVLVDEFQDINPLDLALIRAIVERNRASLTVVGDDDQAIFEWRGATPAYILEPAKFLGVPFVTHTLSTNYRSPRNILQHSQSLIKHNRRRVDKDTRAFSNDDAQIRVIQTDGIGAALDFVYEEVKRVVEGGRSPSRIAIIGRKRSQIIPYQVFFASKDVSFCAAEDLQVFLGDAFDSLLELLTIKERASIRTSKSLVVEDLLKLCDVSKRYPLKKSDRQQLKQHLQRSDSSSLLSAIGALYEYRGPLKGSNTNGAMAASVATGISRFLQASTVSETLMDLEAGFEGLRLDLFKAEEDVFFAGPPFEHLADYALRYGDDYGLFIEDIERAKAQLVFLPPYDDEGGRVTEDLWRRPVHLMTALRAKGKEFDSVILLDVNDGIWPNRNARTPEQLEAERRVFYVGFTRARKSVLILLNSRLGDRVAIPSPYIEELGLKVD